MACMKWVASLQAEEAAETAALADEAEMPLEQLLAAYGYMMPGADKPASDKAIPGKPTDADGRIGDGKPAGGPETKAADGSTEAGKGAGAAAGGAASAAHEAAAAGASSGAAAMDVDGSAPKVQQDRVCTR